MGADISAAKGELNNICAGLLADSRGGMSFEDRFRFREGKSSRIGLLCSSGMMGEDGGGVCNEAAFTVEPVLRNVRVRRGDASPASNSAVSIRIKDGRGNLTGLLGLGTEEPGLRVAVVVLEACDVLPCSLEVRLCRGKYSPGSNCAALPRLGGNGVTLAGFLGLGTVDPGRVAVIVLEAWDILSCPLEPHDAWSLLSHSASSA